MRPIDTTAQAQIWYSLVLFTMLAALIGISAHVQLQAIAAVGCAP